MQHLYWFIVEDLPSSLVKRLRFFQRGAKNDVYFNVDVFTALYSIPSESLG